MGYVHTILRDLSAQFKMGLLGAYEAMTVIGRVI